MDFKKLAKDTFDSKKFEGFTVDASVVNSRLHLTVQVKGSVDLPGDSDFVLAQLIGLLGVGNSPKPSDSASA